MRNILKAIVIAIIGTFIGLVVYQGQKRPVVPPKAILSSETGAVDIFGDEIPEEPTQEITYKLHTTKYRSWGYEIPITFNDTGKDYNIVMLFKNKPTETEIKEMIAFWENKIKAEKLEKEPETEILLKSEVESILRGKGYLTEQQTWETLPIKEKSEVIVR